MIQGRTRRRSVPLLTALATLAVMLLGSAAGALAAGGATFADGAHLFTGRGRAAIHQVAQGANLRVLVVTTTRDFPTRAAWHRYVRGLSTDRGGITIGLLPARRDVYALVGPDVGLSPAQASQGVARARPDFDAGHITAGVIRMIRYYHDVGARSPSSART